ncbi:MAG TPA: hypothetical protein VMT03_03905 [Polyangia bacterium]|nr:hypothetical protein [Polyangia bacterium]
MTHSSRVTLAALFACEVAAAMLVGAAGKPLAGTAFVAAALALGFRWMGTLRKQAQAAQQARLAIARAEAQGEAASGRAACGVEILERVRVDTPLDGPSARLLIELYASCDELSGAVEIALEHLPLLDPADVRNMIASLEAWNERQHAAALAFAVTIQRAI